MLFQQLLLFLFDFLDSRFFQLELLCQRGGGLFKEGSLSVTVIELALEFELHLLDVVLEHLPFFIVFLLLILQSELKALADLSLVLCRFHLVVLPSLMPELLLFVVELLQLAEFSLRPVFHLLLIIFKL